MTPDELLRRHPRATLRGRLGLSQMAFALCLDAELDCPRLPDHGASQPLLAR